MICDNQQVVGTNFHCGITDFDASYMTNDEDLFKLFNELLEENKFNRLDTMREAIRKYMVVKNADVRYGIVEDTVQEYFELMTDNIMKQLYLLNKPLDATEVEVLYMTRQALQAIYNKIANKRY